MIKALLTAQSETHLSGQQPVWPPVVPQFPFLPDNLAGRRCPTKEDLSDPRNDPQTVAQPLGSLEDKTLDGLVLILSLSGLPAGLSADKMTNQAQREEKLEGKMRK